MNHFRTSIPDRESHDFGFDSRRRKLFLAILALAACPSCLDCSERVIPEALFRELFFALLSARVVFVKSVSDGKVCSFRKIPQRRATTFQKSSPGRLYIRNIAAEYVCRILPGCAAMSREFAIPTGTRQRTNSIKRTVADCERRTSRCSI